MTGFNVTSLKNRAVLHLDGSDATTFLQGLITQDINLLDEQPSLYGALLSPQGKILCDFVVHKAETGYLVEAAANAAETLMTRLMMYKLRADVEVRDVSSSYMVVVSPEQSSDISAPDPRSSKLGYRVVLPAHKCKDFAQNDGPYHLHRIKCGIGEGDEIGMGKLFPHECNFDQLGGVSLTKGCFIGQEVVSRMAHRGTVRNRILPFSAATALERDQELRAGASRLGEVLCYRDGYGLALMRLDRLAKTASPVMAGEETISLFKPEWADFELSLQREGL